MFCKKVEGDYDTIYGCLIKLAKKKNIDVYEVNGPKEMNGLFYNLENEGIKAKFILVNINSDKDFTLAYLLEYIKVAGMESGYIKLREKKNKKAVELKAEKLAERIISILKKSTSHINKSDCYPQNSS